VSARRLALLCEGPEDLVALREALLRQHGLVAVPGVAAPGAGGPRRSELRTPRGDTLLTIIVGGGRPDIHTKWVKEVRSSSPSDPYVKIAVSFDPDGDPESDWRRQVFEEAWGAPALVPDARGGRSLRTRPPRDARPGPSRRGIPTCGRRGPPCRPRCRTPRGSHGSSASRRLASGS